MYDLICDVIICCQGRIMVPPGPEA